MKIDKVVMVPILLLSAVFLTSCFLTNMATSALTKAAGTAAATDGNLQVPALAPTEYRAPAATALATVNKAAGNVLFSDDFSDPSSGWNSTTTENGSTDYADGTYAIIVTSPNYELWANPGRDFTDVSIETDATKVAGPDDNDFGLICRYQDVDNYYFSEIASDGYYVFGAVKGGALTYLDSDSMIETGLVYAGSETNHLRLDCNGNTLTLYINGTLAGTASDSDYSSGDVGLVAGSYDTAGVDIAFDNFVVSKP